MRTPWAAARLPPLPTWPTGPTLCEVCRRWSDGALCDDCLRRHAAPVSRCDGCGLRLAAGAARCGECLREPLPFARCRCAVDYGFPWDALVAGFKYHGRAELAAPLAERLLAALSPADRDWPELVVPVPLAASRLAERGYDQAWELARRVGRALGRPADATALARLDGRTPQAGLRRAERRRNLRGAFRATRPERVAGRRVALVDDVLTTGATAAEATLALHAADASEVAVWTLARTA
jgi:ComF family protein